MRFETGAHEAAEALHIPVVVQYTGKLDNPLDI